MNSNGRLQFSAIGAMVVLSGLALPAAAAPVCAGALLMNPGDTVVTGAGAFGDCTGTAVASTLLAFSSAPFTTSTGNTSGTLISAVYRENGSGTLDFYYQVVLNTTSTNCPGSGQPTCNPIARETNSSFIIGGTWTTWAATRGDSVGPFSAGTVFPITADRNVAGDIVGFSFNPPDGAKISPGQTSSILIVSTNAPHFAFGAASVINGGAATVSAFRPSLNTPLVITTTSVANGTVGTPYTQNLIASGGTPPYSWSILGRGRLPVGLTFNPATGQISGTPTYAETSIVTFQVTDSGSPVQTATVTLVFTITSP